MEDNLEEKLARKTKELEIVQRVAVALNASSEVSTIASLMLNLMEDYFGFQHSILLVLRPDEEELEVVATHGYEVDNLGKTVKVGMGVIGMVAKKQRLMRMANLGAQRQYMQAISKSTGAQAVVKEQIVGLPDAESQVAMPMMAEDRLLGVLSIESRKMNFYNPQDETLVTTLANLGAVSLKNALYLQQVEEAREQLREINANLEHLVTERTKELADAHADIVSSISYASRIQREFIPRSTTLQDHLKDFGVVWQPRDVVGGDFYWFQPQANGYLVGLGDCTGHGVPGAFMSLVSISTLNRIVRENDLSDLAGILKQFDASLRAQLGRSDEDNRDGLDFGLCYLNPNEQQLRFVGAKMSLFHMNKKEVTEISGARKSIGYDTARKRPFRDEIEMNYSAGDTFLMASDGVIDQMGGGTRMCFGKQRLEKFLTEHKEDSSQQICDDLITTLSAYRGNNAVLDDVTVFCFRPN
jgi:serine phosphatase RsbU (regulator of sigma subunit)